MPIHKGYAGLMATVALKKDTMAQVSLLGLIQRIKIGLSKN